MVRVAWGLGTSRTIISVMMPQRTFGSTNQPGEVIASNILDGLSTGFENITVRQNHRQSQQVVSSDTIFQGLGASGICSHRTTHGGGFPGTWIRRVHETQLFDLLLEVEVDDTGFDPRKTIVRIYLENLVHTAHCQDDSTSQGNGLSGKIRARTPGCYRYGFSVCYLHDCRYFIRAHGIDYNVRPMFVQMRVERIRDQVFGLVCGPVPANDINELFLQAIFHEGCSQAILYVNNTSVEVIRTGFEGGLESLSGTMASPETRQQLLQEFRGTGSV